MIRHITRIDTVVDSGWTFCCDKLEQIWISHLLDKTEEGKWYIKTEEEYDYLYLTHCPFCGEPIYEEKFES